MGDQKQTSEGAQDDDQQQDESISEGKMAELNRPVEELLGADAPFESDELAPPVDESWVVAYVRGELSREERADVRRLIARFRSWRNALDEVLKRRLHGPPTAEPPADSPAGD